MADGYARFHQVGDSNTDDRWGLWLNSGDDRWCEETWYNGWSKAWPHQQWWYNHNLESRSRGRDCQLDSLPRSMRTVMTTCRSEAANIHYCENTFKDAHKRDCGNGSLTNVTERMKTKTDGKEERGRTTTLVQSDRSRGQWHNCRKDADKDFVVTITCSKKTGVRSTATC